MSPAPVLAKPRILILAAAQDDYTEFHGKLTLLYDVNWAGSLTAAIDLYAKETAEAGRLDVVLIEEDLPDGSGLFFLQYIQERDSSISAAIISAANSIETAISALRLNAFEFIRKPVTTKSLLTAISKGIRKTLEARQIAKRQHVGDAAAQLAHDVASIVTIMSFNDPSDPVIQHSVQRIAELYSHFRQTQNGALFFRNYPLPSLMLSVQKDLLDWIRAYQAQPIEVVFTEIPMCKISVDRIYFSRILENLMRNAVQAMESVTGRTKQLHVSAVVKAGNALISIKDTGIGMESSVVERIFDPYFTSRSDGIGLGLHICRQFVRDMKGTIKVESAVNEGTCFTITFPIVEPGLDLSPP